MRARADGSDIDLIDGLTESERAAIAESIREQDTLELLTVGIDVGSSTTHLLFARVHLRREVHELSSRFVVASRSVEWESPILLTPFVSDGTIDAEALRVFFDDCYRSAGFTKEDIDSGAVILTGEAIKRSNARAIDELFASESGKFVCATAGHELESTLAAHGSGATALSQSRAAVALHVDIGGGTTKMSLLQSGEVVSVSAFAVGGRLLATDEQGDWTRIDESAVLVANELGIEAMPSSFAEESNRLQVVARLATLLCDQILGGPVDDLGRALCLTGPLDRSKAPEYLTFSGGVSEYFEDRDLPGFGDIARGIADEVRSQLSARSHLQVVSLPRRIRATVIGASQYTVQVSGKTIFISSTSSLPVRNVPVARIAMNLDGAIDENDLLAGIRRALDLQNLSPSEALAVSLRWTGQPTYERLITVARAISRAVSSSDGSAGEMLIVAIEGDVGLSMGRLMSEDLSLERPFIVADGLSLNDFEFIDVGELQTPPGVVPVIIKSLLFQ